MKNSNVWALAVTLALLLGCGGDGGSDDSNDPTPNPTPSAIRTEMPSPKPTTTAVQPEECITPLDDLDGKPVPVEHCDGQCVSGTVFTSCVLTRRGGNPTGVIGEVQRTEVEQVISCTAPLSVPSGSFQCNGGEFERSELLTERKGTFNCERADEYSCTAINVTSCRKQSTDLGVPGPIENCQ